MYDDTPVSTPAERAGSGGAEPSGGKDTVINPSLWRLPAMRSLAFFTLASFIGFFATIAALPAWITQQGIDPSRAGFATTTLLTATVAAQGLVPRLVQRVGMTRALGLGAIFLGAPSLLFLIDGGYAWVLMICALRGIGFGIVTVLGSMLTARIAPPRRRGEAVGIYGLAIAVPNLSLVAGGVALVSAGHFLWVAILGAAPLLGLLAVRGLARAAGPDPDGGRAPAADDPAARAAARRSRRTARNAALGPAVVLMVVTLASGGFMTYLPIARPGGSLATIALLVWGAAGAIARWRVGMVADRMGLRLLLPAASALSIIGIGIVVGGMLLDGTALILIGAVILGTGFGSTQNLTLVAAFMQARQRETATVSAVWNIGFDAGTAIGSGLVGLLILVMTIPSAIALTAVLVAVSIPWAIRGGRPPA